MNQHSIAAALPLSDRNLALGKHLFRSNGIMSGKFRFACVILLSSGFLCQCSYAQWPRGISLSKPLGDTGVKIPPVNQWGGGGGSSSSDLKSGGGPNSTPSYNSQPPSGNSFGANPSGITAPSFVPNHSGAQNFNRPMPNNTFSQPSQFNSPNLFTPSYNNNNSGAMVGSILGGLLNAANTAQQQQRPQQNLFQPSNQQNTYSNNNRQQYSGNNQQYYPGNRQQSYSDNGQQYYYGNGQQYYSNQPQGYASGQTYSGSTRTVTPSAMNTPVYNSVPSNVVYTSPSATSVSTGTGGGIAQTSYREPPVAPKRYSQLPIKLILPNTESGTCDYTLIGNSKNYNYSMSPGNSQTFTEDRHWKVRYFSEGKLQEFDLKGGQTYEFVREDNAWKLYKME